MIEDRYIRTFGEERRTDLASRHAIGVFPVGGWWREKPKLERSNRRVRYTLVVSLRANVEINLYTEIANAVGIEIDVGA